jgi:hypothetical protein
LASTSGDAVVLARLGAQAGASRTRPRPWCGEGRTTASPSTDSGGAEATEYRECLTGSPHPATIKLMYLGLALISLHDGGTARGPI